MTATARSREPKAASRDPALLWQAFASSALISVNAAGKVIARPGRPAPGIVAALRCDW
jgi:hypothetical protein